LARLIEGIGKVLEGEGEGGEWRTGDGAGVQVSGPLSALKAALEARNMKEIDKLLEELERLPLDAETREGINAVSDRVLMGEYAAAVEIVDSLSFGV
jgi:hypothetical protein